MAKATVASSLMMKSLKSRLCQLTKSFDIGICCSKCAVEAPDGPKDEYYLLGHTPTIAEGICFSGHATCSRDWILCKENSMNTWFRVRPIYESPKSPSSVSVCDYAVSGGSSCGKKCPSGEMCVNAHSDVEYSVWTIMIEVNLDYDSMRGVLLEEIGKYMAETMKKRQEMPTAVNATSSGDGNTTMAIPEDAVRPGCHYEEQGFFINVNKKTYLTIRATRVDGPDRFYFQLCENIERMEECWKDMDVFYKSEEGDKYKTLEDDLMRNLPVAAKFWSNDRLSSYWRRAEIIDYTLGSHCLVEVMDVDYGTVSSVKLDDVRLLRAEYFTFQKQAIEATVAYVCPAKGDHWTAEAVDVTRSLFEKWPLVAEVVGTVGGTLALMVCDTSDPTLDVYFTDVLIKGGHGAAFNGVTPLAFFGKQSLTKPAAEVENPH